MSLARLAVAARTTPKRVAWSSLLGLVLWAAAVACAFKAQTTLTSQGGLNDGAAQYGFAALLAIIAFALIDRSSSPERTLYRDKMAPAPADSEALRRSRPIQIASVVLVAIGALADGVAVYIAETSKGTGFETQAWGIGLSALALGFGLWALGKSRLRFPRVGPWLLLEIFVVIVILAVATTLRMTDLAQIPPDVHGDEAAMGLDGRRFLSGEVQDFFGTGWNGFSNLSFGLIALSMRIFGDNLFGLRMGSAIEGVLSILLLYLITRKLFSARIAAVAAFLLAVSAWHIHYSRDGLNNMQALLAELLVFFFLLRGIQHRRGIDFLLAGFAAGFAMNVYFGAKIALVLVTIYILFKAISERDFLRRTWPGLLVMLLGFLAFMAPMIPQYAKAPASLITRADTVFILSPQNLKHSYQAYQVDDVADVMRLQILHSALAFNQRGETSIQYGHRAPLLDFWSGALAVLGAAVVTLRWHRWKFFFVSTWFGLVLVTGSILTLDAMFSPRLIGLVPVPFIFAAIVVDAGWRATGQVIGRWGSAVFALPLAAFLVLAAQGNYEDYFETHVKKMMPAGFFSSVSNYILSNNDQYRVYLIGNADTTLRYETPRFLLSTKADAVDVRDQQLALPLNRVPEKKGVVFVIAYGSQGAEQRLRSLLQVYPDGQQDVYKTANGAPLFYSYVVERESLLRAKPDALVDHAPIPSLDLSQVLRN